MAAACALVVVLLSGGSVRGAAAPLQPAVTTRILAGGADVTDWGTAEGTPVQAVVTIAGAATPPTGSVTITRYDTLDCSGTAAGAAVAALAPTTRDVPHSADVVNQAGWDSATSWNSNGVPYVDTNWFGSLFAGNDLANFASSSMAWRFAGLPLGPDDTLTAARLDLRIRRSRPNLVSESWGTWSTVLAADTESGADFAGLTPDAFLRRFNLQGPAWAIPFTYAEPDPFGNALGTAYAAAPDMTQMVAARLADPTWSAGGAIAIAVLNARTQGIAEAAVEDVPGAAVLHLEWTQREPVAQGAAPAQALALGAHSVRAAYAGDAAYGPAAAACVSVSVAPLDSDGDGYSDAEEAVLGKDAFAYCAVMRADVNADGVVNVLDLAAAAAWYNRPLTFAAARFEQGPPSDGVVNVLDLARMAAVYRQRVSGCP